jgi:uncharacterized protein YndB with AHSA1/START domain
MRTITHAFDVAASPESIYDALTSEEGLCGWWTETATIDRDETPDRIDFRFGAEFRVGVAIESEKEPRLVRWRCTAGSEEWLESTLAFELQRRDHGTLVLFEHDYARELEREHFGRFNFNWAYYLQSLKALCETGQGFPFEEE